MSIPIHPFACLQRSVFLLNSRPGLFTATLLPILLPRFRRLFFRSYKTNLQSSLGKIISSALEYSSHPPVSVYGTIIICLTLEIISRQPSLRNFLNPKAQSLSRLNLKATSIWLAASLNGSTRTTKTSRTQTICVIPSKHTIVQEYLPVSHRLRFSASS